MILLASKHASVSALVLFLTLSSMVVVVKSNKYSKNIRKSASCTGEFCEAKDEYDEPCMDERKKGDPGQIDDDEPTMDDKDELPEDGTEEFDYPKEGLYRWDPVKVGHTRELELEPNTFYSMITRALDPPIFEIPGFLTGEECEGIINRTRKQGLFTSHVHIDPESREYEKKTKELVGHAKSPAGKFNNWDVNSDGLIDKEEVKKFAAESKYLYLSDEEVNEMIENMELSEFDDGKQAFFFDHYMQERAILGHVIVENGREKISEYLISDVDPCEVDVTMLKYCTRGIVTQSEFKNLRTAGMEKYFLEMKKTHPKHRDRYSQQTWLPQRGTGDKMLRTIRRRVSKLTRLPMNVVAGGEHLQVVHYNINGHYHAHYDSQSNKQFPQYKCCHQNLDKLPECRLCRYITVLYYLNQPEAGGETAFPAADVESFNETEFRLRKKGDQYNLSQFCHNAALVVPPKRGTAIMWYNHYLDDSGWLADLDWKTLHGGCDILKGEKWIANNWLTAPNFEEKHIPSNYYLKDLEDTEELSDSNGYDEEEDE